MIRALQLDPSVDERSACKVVTSLKTSSKGFLLALLLLLTGPQASKMQELTAKSVCDCVCVRVFAA